MLHGNWKYLRQGGRQWMEKQARDPFVLEARRRGYVARSAFKLLEMDDKFGLFARNHTRVVVDIGCSPGGWLQVARERCGDRCALFGVDLLHVSPAVTGAVCIQGDFTDMAIQQQLLSRMENVHANGLVDVVMSDMCLNRGSGGTDDRQKQMQLNMEALAFATSQLRTGGNFVCKVLGTPTAFEELRGELQRWFVRSTLCKPFSSRRGSDEAFMVCLAKRETPRPRNCNIAEGETRDFGLDDWPGFLRRPRQRR
ncbi:putative ribosomal RNA methyltransferase [Trypanosoma cruzi]|uniref:rRNA methyltransferase 2, mitochondrial n=3 Tax=Trypanosoma cruzi TaxID=5693 RepID=Q4DYN4_TRYCC|nr:ribosomal RNA methyltransferase, putative [Trypanosoma cruzi]EAN97628.1 ribosomal RNA methyltransferase, putative [Trypanosoma cruzi]PWV12150.1 putative ribosomal RNA methyltransferase [Trypanosoma cruzi]RNC56370.1 ribosomal RNA methyltransferase [Trypanosoma cruzi]|eukprot:XP_819479.1 ribosomal RNA methyltransferase [Trypanosoma cruzi strain CL Brener]